ncbi:MAG: T9SS type A sorting domain-containing protein [Saprospiraceae bacterium]|nr:T9SS type A sorting domain-containing protein [Saprospiraceae bacterium]
MKTTCFRLCLLFILFKLDIHAMDFSFYLECPPNLTIQCTDDVSNLDKYGQAYVWLNYKKKPLAAKTTIYNTNACGIGTITRTWEAEDPYWKIHTCSQIITVTGSILFSGKDIFWPRDTSIEGCNPNPDPKNLPYGYAYPQFNRLKCSQAMYSYKDSKFTVSAGCMKVLREWKVIDWCQYVPNKYPAVGQWSYIQVIKLVVNDSSAVLNCPKDTLVDTKLDCKSTYVQLTPATAVSKCGNALVIRNTSPYSKSKGADASGDYPLGTTEFYFYAEYGCGKELKCKVRVTVRNKIGPIPYCLNGLIVALMPVDTNKDGTPDDGMVQIWAKDFNLGSYHPCGYKQLKFSFSEDTSHMSQVYTCADLGKNEVRMYVTDSLGNQSFCKTYVEIQNNNARIPDCKRKDSITTSTVLIAGLVLDPTGNPCPGIVTRLIGETTSTINVHTDTIIKTKYDTIVAPSGTVFYIRRQDTSYATKSDTSYQIWEKELATASDGKYTYSKLAKSKNYTLSLDRRESEFKGININDVIVLLKHIIGTEKLTDPYKLLAADVNGDELVDQSDFDLLYDLVLGIADYQTLSKHWRLLRKPILFKDPFNPFTTPMEASVDFKAVQIDYPQVNFTAVKIGELDGFDGLAQIQDRSKDLNKTVTGNMSELVVYPNPVSQQQVYFNFNLNQKSQVNIRFYNQQMQLVKRISSSFEKGSQHLEVNLSDVQATGILFYELTDGSSNLYGKLIYSK